MEALKGEKEMKELMEKFKEESDYLLACTLNSIEKKLDLRVIDEIRQRKDKEYVLYVKIDDNDEASVLLDVLCVGSYNIPTVLTYNDKKYKVTKFYGYNTTTDESPTFYIHPYIKEIVNYGRATYNVAKKNMFLQNNAKTVISPEGKVYYLDPKWQCYDEGWSATALMPGAVWVDEWEDGKVVLPPNIKVIHSNAIIGAEYSGKHLNLLDVQGQLDTISEGAIDCSTYGGAFCFRMNGLLMNVDIPNDFRKLIAETSTYNRKYVSDPVVTALPDVHGKVIGKGRVELHLLPHQPYVHPYGNLSSSLREYEPILLDINTQTLNALINGGEQDYFPMLTFHSLPVSKIEFYNQERPSFTRIGYLTNDRELLLWDVYESYDEIKQLILEASK